MFAKIREDIKIMKYEQKAMKQEQMFTKYQKLQK